MSLAALTMMAQDIVVNVIPAANILPPQALLYINTPERYFSVTLTNTTNEDQNIYLAMQIEQVVPNTGLCIITPPRRQPARPFVVKAGANYTLSPSDLKHLFDHIPANEIVAPPGLFENYMNGSFGMLPEGQYQAQVTAYRWNPAIAAPPAISNPRQGVAQFSVCYKAQPPSFIAPVEQFGSGSTATSVLNYSNPLFVWTQPVVNCAPRTAHYRYSLRIVQLMPGQQYDRAMDQNPVVYQADGLTMAQCMIPTLKLREMRTDCEYLAQVTATSASTDRNLMDYVSIENKGKSAVRRFRIVNDMNPGSGTTPTGSGTTPAGDTTTPTGGVTTPPTDPTLPAVDGGVIIPPVGGGTTTDTDVSGDDDSSDADGGTTTDTDASTTDTDASSDSDDSDDDSDERGKIAFGETSLEDSIDNTVRYTFRNPRMREPIFSSDEGARKHFIGEDIPLAWDKVAFMGGEGAKPDTLNFTYTVELFNGKNSARRVAAFETKPIWTKLFNQTETFKDTIRWKDIADKATGGDYLVLRIRPACLNETSIAFKNDSINTIDFALIEHAAHKYFQCSSSTDISGLVPWEECRADDLKGQTVAMGHYNLTIDNVRTSSKGKGFSGDGHIEWNPMGMKVLLAVSFDTLQVTDKFVAVRGLCEVKKDKTMSGAEITDEIFSDTGLDKLIGESSLPYGAEVLSSGKGALASALGKKTEIGQYYAAIKTSGKIKDWIKKGQCEDVHLPIGMPDVVANESPVNIQITTMKFAPTWATMDLLGEFELPKSNYVKNDILMFGAPRLCMDPDRFLPESGTLALLADFVITDPESGYECNFKAPKNLIYPVDGCFVSWHADAFEMLGVDIDMKIPNLKKVEKGEVTKEMPVLNLLASIGNDWNDWMVDNVTMDPFEADDLPGWTFTAKNIVYDHSTVRNSATMGTLPSGYDKSWLNGKLNNWEGLYIGEVSVEFPKSLEIGSGSGGSRRFKASIQDMFIDDSGISFDGGVDNIIKAETGKLGGWAFSIDRVSLRVVQNSFSGCGFKGKMKVPLTDGEIGYACNMYPIEDHLSGGKNEWAYIFKVQQIDKELTLDLFLASAEFDKDQTYFLVESTFEKGERKTRVELLMGGTLNIGSASANKKIKDEMDKLALPIKIPGVHFAGLRFANCKADSWTSYDEEVNKLHASAKGAAGKLSGLKIVDDKEYQFCDGKFFISRGAWSLASVEKQIGQFKFTLSKYDLSQTKDDKGREQLTFTLGGEVGIFDDMISAGAEISINARITGMKEAVMLDFSKLGAEYAGVDFGEFTLACDFAGTMKLEGTLLISNKGEDKGFSGTIDITLPFNFLKLGAAGGFFEHSGKDGNYKWGYFEASVGGNALNIPPVQVTEVTGGFFFNCKRTVVDGKVKGTPVKDLIGIYLKVGLGMSGAPETFNASCELVISYMKDKKRFNEITLTGKAHMLASSSDLEKGIINAEIKIRYKDEPDDRFFQITITADADADVSKAVYQQLAGKLPINVPDKFGDLMDGFDSKNDGSTDGHKSKDANDNNSKANKMKAKMGFRISIDLKFELEMKNKAGKQAYYTKPREKKDCKWHVYIGEPGNTEADRLDKRCGVTFIDFQLGGKDDAIAVWAKLYANMYLCFGNELPNNGMLPPIPREVREFLDGKDVNGSKQTLSTSGQSKREAAVRAMLKNSKGGFMIGAEIGGNFGCNAIIAYAEVNAILGFDLILQNLGNNAACDDGRAAGKNGFYALGQMYALLEGKLGLMLNLWIFKGKIPLVEVGLGALIQAGLPNPTWVYGKARAKCSLLGGLIKFNQSISFEAGKVCTPLGKNPLDDIEMFGDTKPEYESESEGWKDEDNVVDPYIKPRFTTNMQIDQVVRLVSDESESKTTTGRTYRFIMNKAQLRKHTASGTGSRANVTKNPYSINTYESKSTDKTNWTLDIAALDANTYYSLYLSGYAQEYANGQWGNPWFDEVKDGKVRHYQQAWSNSKTVYFKTGPLPDHLVDADIAVARPGTVKMNGSTTNPYKCTTLYTKEARRPYLSLVRSRADLFKKGFSMWMRISAINSSNKWVVLQETPISEYRNGQYSSYNTQSQTAWTATTSNTCYVWRAAQDLTYSTTAYTNYRLEIIRRDDTKYNKFMEDAKKKTTYYKNGSQTTSVSTSTSTTSYLTDNTTSTTSLQDAMNKIANAEQADLNKNYTEKSTRDFANDNAAAGYEEIMYSCQYKILNYTDVVQHFKTYSNSVLLQHLRNNDFGRQYITRFYGMEDNVTKGKTGSTDCYFPDYDKVDKTYVTSLKNHKKSPYAYLAWVANYATFPGITIKDCDYCPAITTTEGMYFLMGNGNKLSYKHLDGGWYTGDFSTECRRNYTHTADYAGPNGYTNKATRLIDDIMPSHLVTDEFVLVNSKTHAKVDFTQVVKEIIYADCREADSFRAMMGHKIQTYVSGKKVSDMKTWIRMYINTVMAVDGAFSYYLPFYQLGLMAGVHNDFKNSPRCEENLKPLLYMAQYKSGGRTYGGYWGDRKSDKSVLSDFGSNTTIFYNDYPKTITKLRFDFEAPMYLDVTTNKFIYESYPFDLNNPFK